MEKNNKKLDLEVKKTITGSNPKDTKAPPDEYLNVRTEIPQIPIRITPNRKSSPRNTPKAVATPFPPLKCKNIEKM
jgi:hypothetical protein